ncbi:MAG: hypothetical protein EOP83_27310, partial [Verrucomicrobiaceae bacterium]
MSRYQFPYFGPCTREEFGNPTIDPAKLWIFDGVVNPNHRTPDGKPLYRLTMMNPNIMCSKLEVSGLPDEVHSTGVCIIEAGQQAPVDPSGPSKTGVMYAADLYSGCRMDVGLVNDQHASVDERTVARERWRSVMHRKVKYTDHPWIAVVDGDRDEGLLRTGTVTDTEDQSSHEVEVLATWTGPSLGLPPAASEAPAMGPDNSTPEDDLEISLSFDMPSAGGSLPPLREGRRYVVGLRGVFAGMTGRPLSATNAFYQQNPDMVLGDGVHAFTAARYGNMSPPGILLEPDDPVVVTRSDDRLFGETLVQAVIRDGASNRVRIIVPPRVPLAEGEWLGLFDRETGPGIKRPRGSLDRLLETSAQQGAFPVAIAGGIRDADEIDAEEAGAARSRGDTATRPEGPKVRGPVARRANRGDASSRPFYADPWARKCRIELCYLGVVVALDEIEFWTGAATNARLADYIRLEFTPGRVAVPQLRVVRKFGARTVVMVTADRGQAVDVLLKAVPDRSTAVRHARVAAAIGRLSASVSRSDTIS